MDGGGLRAMFALDAVGLVAALFTTTTRTNPTRRGQPTSSLLAIRTDNSCGVGDELARLQRGPERLNDFRNRTITKTKCISNHSDPREECCDDRANRSVAKRAGKLLAALEQR
ncbi:MAG: hypothetical protein ACLP50_36280 [Solirubrobacteraceae bacterium]